MTGNSRVMGNGLGLAAAAAMTLGLGSMRGASAIAHRRGYPPDEPRMFTDASARVLLRRMDRVGGASFSDEERALVSSSIGLTMDESRSNLYPIIERLQRREAAQKVVRQKSEAMRRQVLDPQYPEEPIRADFDSRQTYRKALQTWKAQGSRTSTIKEQ